jgi:uncharacterized protein (TIGR02270 family)
MTEILEDVVQEHAEEAAFLWQQREMAVRAPDFDIEDIAESDERVEAHLDGLRIAGESSWDIAKEIGWDLGGEFFTGMWLALEHGRTEWIREMMEAAEDDAEATSGVVSAFGWIEKKKLQGHVKQLLKTSNPYGRQIGIGACAIHRVNPGATLESALKDDHEGLRARALKAIGELGLNEYLPQLEKNMEHENDECRFWAAWSAGLLGSRNANKILGLFGAVDNTRRRQALELGIRLLEPEQAHHLIRELVADKAQLRWALMSAGYQGDPVYLEPLMKQFGNDEVARVAGESFEMITGLNIFLESLEVIPDVEQQPEPSKEELQGDWEHDDDDDDDDVLDEDEGLVVPDPEKIQPWYDANKNRFPHGERILCGHPLSQESCATILLSGQQRQRRAAALEMALANPGTPLFETRAPGRRQLECLRDK